MQEPKDSIPEPNFFQCPNLIVDSHLKDLSGSELKCLLFIIRKTKGWRKDIDAISVSQFEEATGLSNRAVIDACNSLVARGFVFQSTGVRGVKLFTLDGKKFTSEESSLVKKVHSTSEKSSQVTSEKSSHTKDTIKYTTKNTVVEPEQVSVEQQPKPTTNKPTQTTDADPDWMKQSDAERKAALANPSIIMDNDYQPDLKQFADYCKRTGVDPNKLNDQVLAKFTSYYLGKVKTASQWLSLLAIWVKREKPEYQPQVQSEHGQSSDESIARTLIDSIKKTSQPLPTARSTETPETALKHNNNLRDLLK